MQDNTGKPPGVRDPPCVQRITTGVYLTSLPSRRGRFSATMSSNSFALNLVKHGSSLRYMGLLAARELELGSTQGPNKFLIRQNGHDDPAT